MSYYIATEITITPDRIVSAGYDNNVLPHIVKRHILKRTEDELKAIARDLIADSIVPRQKWWQNTQELLKQRFTYTDMDSVEKQKEAAAYMMDLYDNEISNKHKEKKLFVWLLICESNFDGMYESTVRVFNKVGLARDAMWEDAERWVTENGVDGMSFENDSCGISYEQINSPHEYISWRIEGKPIEMDHAVPQ